MDDTLDRADAAMRHFDGAAALALYDAALAEGSNDGDRAVVGRVRALWMLRRWDEARAEFAKLTDHTDSLLVELTRGMLALGQPDDPAWFSVDCGSALRDDTQAADAFLAARDLDGGSPEAVAGYATALRMAGNVVAAQHVIADAQEDLRSSAVLLVEQAMCATELGDLGDALKYAERACNIAPGDMHAHLVRFTLLRRDARGSDDAVFEVETTLGDHADPTADLRDARGSEAAVFAVKTMLDAQAVPTANLLESYGWALTDAAQAEVDLLPRRELLRKAREAFHRSMDVGPVIPGAVNGRVAAYLEHDDFDAALELVDDAIAREPTSPQLHRIRAEVITASGGTPIERRNAYERVLDLDPRDLDARIQIISALTDLDQSTKAHGILTVLREELPGNKEVAEAVWQTEPLMLSADGSDRTRLKRPWIGALDSPPRVLNLLIDEVVKARRLKPDVAARLREGVDADRRSLLERAYEEEQEYLRRRDEHRATQAHKTKRAALWVAGWFAIIIGSLLALAGVGRLVWLLLSLAGVPTGLMWPLVIGALVLVPAVVWFLEEVVVVFFDAYYGAAWAAAVALAAASIWQGIRLFDVAGGIVAGLVATMAILGTFLGGLILRDEYSAPDEQWVQDAFDEWLEVLYKNAVEPAANEAISRPGHVYGTSLSARSVTASEAIVDVDTDASRALRDLLQHKRGGSFALAGPRGAGKSTLLKRWCAGSFLRAGDEQQTRHDLSVQVDAPVGYQSQEFLLHLFGQACLRVERYAEENEAELRRLPGDRPDPAKVLLRQDSHGVDELAGGLRDRARRERRQIRSLLSHTREGELSVGFTPVVGGKGKVSQRRDELPLTYPELVGRFRDFLRFVADAVGKLDGKVLIAIDELDRITDGDSAQRFINELKAVFTVENCHFLVAVSEDALADFDLAAMGMRTVFDSAFTRIVRVDYLDLDQARVVLRRRTPGIPEQFVALAYALSGGLMRELSRIADEIGKKRDLAAMRTLDHVAKELVSLQLSSTSRAAMDRLSRAHDRRPGAKLIPVLDEHPRNELSATAVREFAAKVRDCLPQEDESEPVAVIRLDVVIMADYLATLLDVFNERLDKDRMEIGRSGTAGDFQTLARVRRYLFANPYGARELLVAFAKAWNLDNAAT